MIYVNYFSIKLEKNPLKIFGALNAISLSHKRVYMSFHGLSKQDGTELAFSQLRRMPFRIISYGKGHPVAGDCGCPTGGWSCGSGLGQRDCTGACLSWFRDLCGSVI